MVGGGRRVFGGTQGGVVEGLGRFGGTCELAAVAGRGRENFFFTVSTRQQQETLEQRAPYGERFHRARGGPVEGLGRFGDACALTAAAGRGRENFFFFYRFSC
jgi:hypothetical protein